MKIPFPHEFLKKRPRLAADQGSYPKIIRYLLPNVQNLENSAAEETELLRGVAC